MEFIFVKWCLFVIGKHLTFYFNSNFMHSNLPMHLHVIGSSMKE